ncbi:MAG: DUF421 domain-containing protein [Syntrophomonadaceae bacterium]|nr:DUF421 domain-containing protein [Syntrophomonadaceae bacterium]
MSEGLIVLVRSIIAFITLFIFARLLGKQQISQLTYFDYVLGITIGSIAASLSVDLDSRAWPHWVGLATWTVCVLLVQWLVMKSSAADKYFSGEPVIVISDGQIMDEAMRKSRFTVSELLEELRHKDVFELSEVQYAVLETDGKLSVLLKPEYRNATIQDLQLASPAGNMSLLLIYDGMIVEKNLQLSGKKMPWLKQQLKSKGIKDLSEVFLASYHLESNTLYIDQYKDKNKTADPQLI